MLSPLTSRVKTSLFLGIKFFGSEKKSFGFSIASIGLPAATLPRRGTSTIFSFLLSNSFVTFNSIVLNLLSVWLMYPFFVKFFRCTNIVAVLFKLDILHSSLIVGEYPLVAINFFISVNIFSCLSVSFSI